MNGSGRSAGDELAVRNAVPGDVDRIKGLAVGNEMFGADELGGFEGLLRGYLTGSLDQDRWLVTSSANGELAGAAYYAPEPFADRVWNLYFLAVQPGRHRRGVGGALVAEVERSLREAGERSARVLLVETSSAAKYDSARRFYLRNGFDQEARIREFYGPGDDKIVFWKSLI